MGEVGEQVAGRGPQGELVVGEVEVHGERPDCPT
jgi:hypothetical protein